MSEFDLIVIGAGPGGYVAAIRGAQLGLKVALIEKRNTLGGTCLNVGCIPSKALLHSTELYHTLTSRGAAHGIKTGKIEVDIAALMQRKTAVVDQLCGGVAQLVKARKITVYTGSGALEGGNKVSVTAEDGNKEALTGKHILLASGSLPTELPFLKFDGKTVVSSNEAIAFDKAPKNLVVIGAGAIGLELGSVWARLGSKVTVIEFLPRVAPTFDADISKLAERIFKRQGIDFALGTKVTGLKKSGKKIFVTAEKDGKELEFEADKVLVAVGRRPYTDGLGLDKAGVKLDERGRIEIDNQFRTSASGIYAIGDVVKGAMLAHKAEEEAVAVVELIAGKAGHVNYDAIAGIVYTSPEIASVGLGEDAAKEKGIEITVGKFPFAANGRAIANDATDGLVKVIADKKTDRLLGVQIIGAGAGELIAEAVAHLEYGGSAEDIARTVHAHPTLSEALKEAALAVSKSAIHAL